MVILKQQLDYNTIIEFGKKTGDSINQSLFFEKPFNLDSVVFEFDSTSEDEVNDIKFRCEIRPGRGSDYLLDLAEDPLMASPWYDDEDIPPTEFSFSLLRTGMSSGFYWFTLRANQRVNLGNVHVLFQKNGSFFGKFLKVTEGTGVYRSNQSLKFKVNGSWVEGISQRFISEQDQLFFITLKDGI